MYLKQLVLKGFKSFADRSVLSFEPGITAVVGPNGSGKSNVSDAVRWVLGERNAHNLRGQSMEDVIFAGSSARKPVNVAEVELVLDNSDGTLPVEFSEVSIARRMYRTGESEYLINGAVARRMDVLDILHDSGLGTGTHSIIAQGHLAQILQSKPEDRRALIEEAAGVLKHKQRKAKSERKLERMDEHLSRVKDVVAEVERQVKPLERKAKRAMAYREASAELAQVSLALAVDDLRALQRKWDEVGAHEKKLVARTDALKESIAKADAEAEALQKRLQDETAGAGKVAALYRRAQAVSDKLDSNVMLLHERKRSQQSYLAEMKLSLEAGARQAQELGAALEEARANGERAAADREAADKALAAARERTQGLQARKRALQQKLDDATRKRRDAAAQLEKARADLSRTQEVLAANRAQEQLIETHARELGERLAQAQGALDDAQAQQSGKDEALKAASAADAAAREAVGTAMNERNRARGALDAARDATAAAKAAVRGFEEVERAHTAANPLLASALEAEAGEADAVAPLIDEIRVPSGLEAAVNAVLGRDVETLLVSDAAAQERRAEDLAGQQAEGRVALLARKGNGVAAGAPAAGDEQPLSRMVECGAAARGAVEALLGDVVLCDGIPQALRYVREHPGMRAVTRGGAVVNANGAVVIARAAAGATDPLANHRALEQAREQAAAAQSTQEEASDAAKGAEEALRAAQQESIATSQALAQAKGDAKSAASELARARAALAAVKREQEGIEKQRAKARGALEAAEPDAARLEARVHELSSAIDDAKEDVEALREELAPVRAQADEASNALAEAKLASATAKERTDYAVRMRLARERDVKKAAEERARTEENMRRKSFAQKRIDPLIEVCNELAQAARARTQQLEDETARSQTASAGLHEQINEARARTHEAHDAFDTANQQLADVRVEKGRLEMQVEAAISTITDDCSTPLEQALSAPELEDRASAEESALKLRRRIKNMGAINPDAAAEYEQLRRRYDYLRAQVDDMVEARASLQKITALIDRRMKDDFLRTFDVVNENFQSIFGTLFPGGSGSLSLVDPDDPENTGVEVNAQPNGKRILKMSLMSGGEKSLTAMALLFAVYKTRATPFYILDEVEAALDDTNLRRLVAYLDSIRDETQFIIITHQRRTMEMADVLYGISMQQDGVTKVMSQRLDKALRYAKG